MRAAIYRAPRVIELDDLPQPIPGPGDVLVEVSHCGICGTDLHLVLEGMGMPNSVGGHEWSGVIAEVGAAVRTWKVGDAVVGGPAPGCGGCEPCTRGRPSLCTVRGGFAGGEGHPGAFAEFKCSSAENVLPVPSGLPMRVAALAEPLSVALHALTVAGVQPGQRALVTGAGPIGLLVTAALRARGVEDIRVSEPAPLRRARAGAVGGNTLLEPAELERPRMPFQLVRDPVDVVFECSGRPEAMESGLFQLDRLGTLVLVGTGIKRPRFDNNRILLNELVVTGAFNYDEGGLSEALVLMSEGQFPTDALIEAQDVPLEGLFAAMEQLERGELAGKVMVVPNHVEEEGD